MVAVRAEYQLRFGLGFGLHAGYFATGQKTPDGPIAFTLTDKSMVMVTGNDAVHLRGALVGATIAQRLSVWRSLSATFRITLGGLVGSVNDERQAIYQGAQATTVQTPSLGYFTFLPEARLGVGVVRHLEINAAFSLLVMRVVHPAMWELSPPTMFGPVTGSYAFDRVVGKTIVAILPGLGIRYEIDAPFGR
jgi:hypothetical protein